MDLVEGEVHLVVEVHPKHLSELGLLELLDERLGAVDELQEEGRRVEEQLDETELVDGRGDVLHPPRVRLQEVGEVQPLALRRLVRGPLVERRPLVDCAVSRATLLLALSSPTLARSSSFSSSRPRAARSLKRRRRNSSRRNSSSCPICFLACSSSTSARLASPCTRVLNVLWSGSSLLLSSATSALCAATLATQSSRWHRSR